jgi:hypothetical protein
MAPMAFHTPLQVTPFCVVYGCDPPFRSYDTSEIRVVDAAQNLAEHNEFLQDVHLRLEQASRWQSSSMTISPSPQRNHFCRG